MRRAPTSRLAAAVVLVLLASFCADCGARGEDAPARPAPSQSAPSQSAPSQSAPSQPAAPPVRQIAPSFIPLYNLGDPPGTAPSGRPTFEVVLPTSERPLGGCERTMTRAVFGRCLAATMELSRRALEATVLAAQKAVEARIDLTDGHRARWIRLLDEVQERWKEARNLECGQLIVLERGPKAQIFEERAECLLAAERDRIADLKRRYGVE